MTLEKRIRRMEERRSSGLCPRCGGTVIVTLGGSEVHSVTRNGYKFPQSQAEVFFREEEPIGRCPLCGMVRRVIKIGSYKPSE